MGVEGVLLTPFPRYLDGPCCQRPTHMVGYVKEDHKKELLIQLHKSRRFIKGAMKIRGVRVVNMAKVVADSGAGWADPIIAHLGAYQEMVAALIADIPCRLAESSTSGALNDSRREKEGASKRKMEDEMPGPSGKYLRHGGSHGGHGGHGGGRRGGRYGGRPWPGHHY